jgi:hypothetical protein
LLCVMVCGALSLSKSPGECHQAFQVGIACSEDHWGENVKSRGVLSYSVLVEQPEIVWVYVCKVTSAFDICVETAGEWFRRICWTSAEPKLKSIINCRRSY